MKGWLIKKIFEKSILDQKLENNYEYFKNIKNRLTENS